jgi:Natural resistance-associated macrophage protein
MGAAAKLVGGGNAVIYATVFGTLSLALQIWVPYRKYVRYLRWLTWSLFAYVATAFVIRIPWVTALRSTVIPSVSRDSGYWMALVAIVPRSARIYFSGRRPRKRKASAFRSKYPRFRHIYIEADAITQSSRQNDEVSVT